MARKYSRLLVMTKVRALIKCDVACDKLSFLEQNSVIDKRLQLVIFRAFPRIKLIFQRD